MTDKRSFTAIHYAALAVGIFCTGTEIFSNVEHVVHQTNTLYDPAVAAIVATSVGVTIALSCAMAAFRQVHLVTGTMLTLAFLLGAGHTLTTTLDRTASARDAALLRKWEADTQHREITGLLQRVSYMAARECGSGRGQRCDSISAEVRIAETRIHQRRGELDSMGKRLAAIFPGVEPATASLYQPMMFPVSLFLMGAFLVAFGINGKRTPPEFDLQLTGRAATQDKARRFVDAFEIEHGRKPSASELARALSVPVATARRIVK